MVGPDHILDPAKIEAAALALVKAYGDAALERAVKLEKDSAVPEFAEAVTLEVERLLKRRPLS